MNPYLSCYFLGFFVTALVIIRLTVTQDKIEVKEFNGTAWFAVFLSGFLWIFLVVCFLPPLLFKKVLMPSLKLLSYDLSKKEKDIPFGTHEEVKKDREGFINGEVDDFRLHDISLVSDPEPEYRMRGLPSLRTAVINSPSVSPKSPFILLSISDGKINRTWDENNS